MGQILHGCARTTEAVRRAIQHSQESLRTLGRRHGVNAKTIAKWRKRTSVADRKTGPAPRSTILSLEQEAVVVAFRRHTLLPLDDCLYALQATIPELTRSSLHRCLQRHDISRLPDVDGDRPRRKKFKTYPIGYFHIDIAEVRTEQGKLYLLVAIDRTSKFAFVEVHEKGTQRVAANFLNALLQAVPYRIHTVLTDNEVRFTTPGNRCSAAAEIKLALQRGELFRAHAFEFACARADIDHRLNKPKYPWTNGQVERMNGTLKEATMKRFYYETLEKFRQHLTGFVNAYNFARRLKTRRGQPHGGSIPPPGSNNINTLANQRIFGCVFLCPNCAQSAETCYERMPAAFDRAFSRRIAIAQLSMRQKIARFSRTDGRARATDRWPS